MAIEHLGNFGSPSKVSTTGLANALAQGAQVGETMRSNRVQENLERSRLQIQSAQIGANLLSTAMQVKSAERDLPQKKVALQIELAKMQEQKDKSDREHATTLLADMSAKYNAMSPDAQKMFSTNPQYQKTQKFIASYLPERVDDNGNLMMMDDKDVITTGIEKIRQNNAQILANGGTLTEGQQKAQDMLDRVSDKDAQIIIDQAAKDLRWNNPKERGTLINSYITAFVSAKEGLKRASNPPKGSPDDSAKGGIPGMNLLSGALSTAQ